MRNKVQVAALSALLLTALLAPTFVAAGSSAAGSATNSRSKVAIAPLVAKNALPGGGTVYTYAVAGTKVSARIPPRGFNPVRASEAKLAEYDFPPRPAGGRALGTWLAAVRNTHRATPPTRMTFWRGATVARQPVAATPDTLETSNVWAGNMAVNETYTNVYGYWVEPSITEADCPSPQMETIWAGIGGWNTGILVQAGTQYGVNQMVSGISNHQAWYETNNAFVPLPVTATVGEPMYVNIYHASSSGYNIYVVNEYTGQAWGVNFVAFSQYDGSTAEFIVEDPLGGVGPLGIYLVRFGTFEVGDAEASINDSTFRGLASWPHDDVEMISDSTGDLMAYAGDSFNSGDSWYDYHENCQ
jgi:hypothetical protein